MDESQPRPDRLRHRRTRSRWSRPAPRQIAEDDLLDALELAHEAIKQASAPRRSSCSRRPASPSGTTPTSTPTLAARYGSPLDAGDRRARPGRHRRRRRRDARATSCPPVAADAGEERHGAPQPRAHRVRLHRRRAPRRGRQGAVDEQFGDADPRAVRRRAGLQGAQVGEAHGAASSGSLRRHQAALPGRRCRRRPRRRHRARAVKAAVDSVYKQIVRTKIAVDKRRPDGRSETEIRADHAARSA